MTTVLVILYVLSAVLPIVGLVKLSSRARAEAERLIEANYGETQELTVNGMGVLGNVLFQAAIVRPRAIAVDFLLVGGGLILGALASIIALYI